jgi:uncharacterized protein (TIGR02186 family)
MRGAAIGAALALLLAGSAQAASPPLVVDLSRHRVAITTGFAGTDLLLFGAIEPLDPESDETEDLVVVVRGPPQPELIRRKARRAGIWINAGQAMAAEAPAFYRVASTRPLALVAAPALLDRLGIGIDRQKLGLAVDDSAESIDPYRDALLRLKRQRGLYAEDSGTIGMLSQRLFRTDLHLPADVAVGSYAVEVSLFRKGRLISRRSTPLVVERVGIGAAIHDFARSESLAYGMIAVGIALLAGWLAALAFGRR